MIDCYCFYYFIYLLQKADISGMDEHGASGSNTNIFYRLYNLSYDCSLVE